MSTRGAVRRLLQRAYGSQLRLNCLPSTYTVGVVYMESWKSHCFAAMHPPLCGESDEPSRRSMRRAAFKRLPRDARTRTCGASWRCSPQCAAPTARLTGFVAACMGRWSPSLRNPDIATQLTFRVLAEHGLCGYYVALCCANCHVCCWPLSWRKYLAAIAHQPAA